MLALFGSLFEPICELVRLSTSGCVGPSPASQRFEHVVQLAAEHGIEPLGAAVGGKGAVDELLVDDDLVAQLRGQAVEPSEPKMESEAT